MKVASCDILRSSLAHTQGYIARHFGILLARMSIDLNEVWFCGALARAMMFTTVRLTRVVQRFGILKGAPAIHIVVPHVIKVYNNHQF